MEVKAELLPPSDPDHGRGAPRVLGRQELSLEGRGCVTAVSLHQLPPTHSLSHLPGTPDQPHLLCVS